MSPRHQRLAAMAIAFAGALPIYFAGAAPTVLDGDTAELQAVGFLGGVAHPTGYPLFVLVSRVFAVLGWGDPACRVTFGSTCCAAMALALFVLVLVEMGLGAFNALLGAMILGSTFSFWSAAQRAEVYPLAFCLFLLALWRSIVALRNERFGEALTAGLLLGLATCGHLMFGPSIAVLGLALAWHGGVGQGLRIPRLLGLLGAFALGLAPYLYIPWADAHGYSMNYLHLVDLASHPLKLPPDFDQPFERLSWMILGRDTYPTTDATFDRFAIRNLVGWGVAHLALFEPGPLALGVAFFGLKRLRTHDARLASLGVLMVAVSLLFTARFAPGSRMVPIFAMPAVLVASAGAAWGLEPAVAWMGRRRGAMRAAAALLLVLVPVAMSLTAQSIRVYAGRHPFTRLRLCVFEENGEIRGQIVPSMRGRFEARRTGEAAMAVMPRDALVVGRWKELMVLYYLHFVEGSRPDLQFQPLKYPAFLPRLTDWQARYALTERPIVFLQPHREMTPHFGAVDSVRSATGEWIVIAREPLHGLPPVPTLRR